MHSSHSPSDVVGFLAGLQMTATIVIDHAERLGRVTFESWQTGNLRAEPDSVVRWKCAGSLLQLQPSPPEQSFYFYSAWNKSWNNLTQCEGTSPPPARVTLAGEGAPPKGTYRELRLDWKELFLACATIWSIPSRAPLHENLTYSYSYPQIFKLAKLRFGYIQSVVPHINRSIQIL